GRGELVPEGDEEGETRGATGQRVGAAGTDDEGDAVVPWFDGGAGDGQPVLGDREERGDAEVVDDPLEDRGGLALLRRLRGLEEGAQPRAGQVAVLGAGSQTVLLEGAQQPVGGRAVDAQHVGDVVDPQRCGGAAQCLEGAQPTGERLRRAAG